MSAKSRVRKITHIHAKVMFLANDWQTALLPVYLTHKMRPIGRFVNARCMFIVHNFGYQGIYPLNKLEAGMIGVVMPAALQRPIVVDIQKLVTSCLGRPDVSHSAFA